MVHPSELLRTNSNETRTFSAPLNMVDDSQLDCGLTNLPILNRCCNLERFAKPKIFLVFLSIVGFLQGVSLTYFRETARKWGKHYNISLDNIDWLIYTNEFFVGIFGLLVSYYGNKIHRISWIGGLTIFQSISSGMLIIPELYRQNYKDQVNVTEVYLCNSPPPPTSGDGETNYIALVVLITFQIFFAMATISFLSHGITYLDDNTTASTSPSYIAIALACRELGKQAGLYFSWIPAYIQVNAIFASPIWLSIASVTFIFGSVISMFPKSMPSVLVRSFSASLVDIASGHEIRQKQIVDGFFKTTCRLLRNPILIVNILCSVIMQSGLINFNIFEKFFNQSLFQVAYDTDTSYTQFTTNILKQPFVAISIIASGFLIAKIRPKLNSLVKWNIIVIILVIVFFGSTAFLKCEPNTKYGDILHPRTCMEKCYCDYKEFQPVCMDSKTYYSPCFAGCSSIKQINSRNVYENCGCNNNSQAAEGPCNATKCDIYYALSQVNRVLITALLASTLITNLMINLRCILKRDKATALGIEATLIGLIPFLPIKAIYGAVAESYCIFPKNLNDDICRLYSKDFGTFLSLFTLGLMVLSLILAVIVLILLKLKPVDIDKIEDDNDENVEPVELTEFSPSSNVNTRLMTEESRDEIDSGRNKRKSDSVDSVKSKTESAHSVESMTESLLEMENVGDDHDSIASASHLAETRPPLNRSRLIESDL